MAHMVKHAPIEGLNDAIVVSRSMLTISSLSNTLINLGKATNTVKPEIVRHKNHQINSHLGDPYALDSAAGGILGQMPQEGLAIIESKSKVRYSRSRANDSRVSTDAPLSNSSPSNNSFDMQQIAASLEDKMTIKMNKMLNEMKALVVTTPAQSSSCRCAV
ncbi:hypothetical protein Tco_0163468 [Tanacetum coccineum]